MNLKKYTLAKLITTVASVATLLAGWGIIGQAGAAAATSPTAVSQTTTAGTGSATTSNTTSQTAASARVTTRTHAS